MPAPSSFAIKITLLLSVTAGAQTAVFSAARAADDGGAIAAGVIGGVAGTIAGTALSGALPPAGAYAPPYPPPAPRCWTELRQERQGYSYHFGQVRVCE